MPEKDPQNYSLLAYLAFGGLSVWGGLVTYIQTVKREGRQFRWFEALLQIVVSGFAGMLTMLLCW
ncbi:MAG: phage holin family protein, partial [Aeromonadaceae bacterium]|nr:phage holin family protein [Aeromonadaceae bacterium]